MSAGEWPRPRWSAREPPLEPLAVVARSGAVPRLIERLLARDDAALAVLSGAFAPGLLIVIGPSEALPWAEGVSYLGRDPSAPRLFLPTALDPGVPAELFERAVARRAARAGPWAVVAEPEAILLLEHARTLDRARLSELATSLDREDR